MKANMGKADRLIRILIAAVIVVLFATGEITGMLAIILIAVSAVFAVTSFFATCPIYWPFGISTIRKKKHA
jgi:hypothetical protein